MKFEFNKLLALLILDQLGCLLCHRVQAIDQIQHSFVILDIFFRFELCIFGNILQSFGIVFYLEVQLGSLQIHYRIVIIQVDGNVEVIQGLLLVVQCPISISNKCTIE